MHSDGPGACGDAVVVNDLTKDYGHGRGAFSVSLTVRRGEVLGFIGPNGAGKTTVIRHIMGFSKPQSGWCAVCGVRTDRDTARVMGAVGYLPGEPALPANLTGAQVIALMEGLRGRRRGSRGGRAAELAERFELDTCRAVRRMSLGEKRKLAIVVAFMHDPDVLILDEPTSGLDPVMQDAFVELVAQERRRGKTVLLSSHMFNEVEAVCDRVVAIRDGSLVAGVCMDELRRPQTKVFEVAFGDVEDLESFVRREGFDVLAVDRAGVALPDRETDRFLGALARRAVVGLKERKQTLADHFMPFYRRDAVRCGEV